MLDTIVNLFGETTIYAIAWTVIHSIWQGTLIALIMSFCLHHFVNKTPEWRYGVTIGAMLLVIVCSTFTFNYYMGRASGLAATDISTFDLGQIIIGIPGNNAGWGQSLLRFLDENLLFISSMWVIGVLVFMIRYVGSLLYIRRLQKAPCQTSVLQSRLIAIQKKMGLQKLVRIMETAKVQAPMVLGHLKPLILFPIGVINSLETEEVNAIIAHELAHIMRNDFLVNLIQSFAEILFYYHPAVWWISANIKAEREACCDRVAINYTGDAISYAKTLVKLKELQTTDMPVLAIPFFQNKKQLLIRIQKILDMPQTKSNIKEKILSMAFLFIAVLIITTQANGNNTPAESIDASTPEMFMSHEFMDRQLSITSFLPQIDTLPETKERKTYHITKSDNEKTVSLKMEDGEIVELKIDEEVIPEEEYEKHEDVIIDLKPRKDGNVFYFGDGTDRFQVLRDQETLRALRDMELDLPKYFEGNLAMPFPEKFDHMKMDSIMKSASRIMGLKNDSVYLNLIEGHEWAEVSGKLREEAQLYQEMIQKQLEEGEHNLWRFEHDGEAPMHFEFKHELPEPFIYEFEHVAPKFHRKRNLEDVIGRALNNDRLLEKDKMNKVELSGKCLKINGDKQPKNIWMKYKELFEEQTGLPLSKDSKLKFEVKGERKHRKAHAF